MIDHDLYICEHQDIERAVTVTRAILTNLKEKAKNKLKLCRVYGDQIRQCRKDTDTHLQALKDEVDSVINEAIKTDKDIEKEDAAKINQEIDVKNQKLQEEIQNIDEKIRQNDEEREERLELNRINAKKRREPIYHKQIVLQSDILNIDEEKERRIVELEKTWQDNTKSTENIIQELDTLLEDDNNVIKDGHHVKTSVSDELEKPLNEDEDEDEMKHITGTISSVRFVKGAGREKYDGRIDGYAGEWKLIDTIKIKDKFNYPYIVGLIDECKVIIRDSMLGCTYHTYMFDLDTRQSQIVITGSGTSRVMSCALLKDGKLVCGKDTEECVGKSLIGCISVYDRQWKHIKDITIPRHRKSPGYTWVDVAADKKGMIIAAQIGSFKIYIINPADGEIRNIITCEEGENMRMLGVLSSGHIIAKPSSPDHRVLIIGWFGAQRNISHSGVILNACIDPMTDDLYAVTSDDECETCAIDQVMSGIDMRRIWQRIRIASFPLSNRHMNKEGHLKRSYVLMTSSGNMIACDGDNILVFKKRLRL